MQEGRPRGSAALYLPYSSSALYLPCSSSELYLPCSLSALYLPYCSSALTQHEQRELHLRGQAGLVRVKKGLVWGEG